MVFYHRMGILFALSLLFTLGTASVTDCSNGASLFKLTSMSFSPDPTVPGQNSTLLLSMTVPQEITVADGATATYTTTYNFIPLSPTVDPLCDVTIPCPILIGALDTYSSIPIDASLTGTLQLKIEWKDAKAQQLMCVLIKTKLG
jgi:hypothetical protein